MIRSFRFRRNGLAHNLIRVHERLLEDAILYFEKGKTSRKSARAARKAIRQAIKVARKKQINPGVKIGMAREALEDLKEEVTYTQSVLHAISRNLEDALQRIEEEKVNEPLALMEGSRKLFREKQIEKAVQVLKSCEGMVRKRDLDRARTALFGGLDNEVKRLRNELKERQQRKS
jgi:primase-polymerase (primpol)-like protein